jgi:CRISPR/Cas system-associated endoribonuclease Cas2
MIPSFGLGCVTRRSNAAKRRMQVIQNDVYAGFLLCVATHCCKNLFRRLVDTVLRSHSEEKNIIIWSCLVQYNHTKPCLGCRKEKEKCQFKVKIKNLYDI